MCSLAESRVATLCPNKLEINRKREAIKCYCWSYQSMAPPDNWCAQIVEVDSVLLQSSNLMEAQRCS